MRKVPGLSHPVCFRHPTSGCSHGASREPLFLLLLAIVMLTLAACEASLTGADLARARAAREYECPPKRIHIKWLSQGPNDYEIYKVAACGTVVTYACNTDKEACVKESDDRR